MSPTSRDSHKAMCFMSLSWRKHPRVMTTSVSPATTTKLIKLRWLTSQKNPHKWSERSWRDSSLNGGKERAAHAQRLVTPTPTQPYLLIPVLFYCKRNLREKKKSKLMWALDNPHSFHFRSVITFNSRKSEIEIPRRFSLFSVTLGDYMSRSPVELSNPLP